MAVNPEPDFLQDNPDWGRSNLPQNPPASRPAPFLRESTRFSISPQTHLHEPEKETSCLLLPVPVETCCDSEAGRRESLNKTRMEERPPLPEDAPTRLEAGPLQSDPQP